MVVWDFFHQQYFCWWVSHRLSPSLSLGLLAKHFLDTCSGKQPGKLLFTFLGGAVSSSPLPPQKARIVTIFTKTSCFQSHPDSGWTLKKNNSKITIDSGQITMFHQPRFSWNKGNSLPFGVRSCEVAIIWPGIDLQENFDSHQNACFSLMDDPYKPYCCFFYTPLDLQLKKKVQSFRKKRSCNFEDSGVL